MGIKGRLLRVTRLDERGQPTGPSIETFASVDSSTQTDNIEQTCIEAGVALHRFSMTIELCDFGRLGKLFYGDDRKYVRTRRYLARTHGHAPRRKNKHGRKGVRHRG